MKSRRFRLKNFKSLYQKYHTDQCAKRRSQILNKQSGFNVAATSYRSTNKKQRSKSHRKMKIPPKPIYAVLY